VLLYKRGAAFRIEERADGKFVVVGAHGAVFGPLHATRAEAEAHVRALSSAVKREEPEDLVAAITAPWREMVRDLRKLVDKGRPAAAGVTFAKTQAELYDDLVEKSVAGFPRLARPQAIAEYLKTDAGRELGAAVSAAPRTRADAIVAGTGGLASLRKAALEEQQLVGDGLEVLVERIEVLTAAKIEKGAKDYAAALALVFHEDAELYRNYRDAQLGRQPTRLRRAYAEALVDDELGELVKGFAGDGHAPGVALMKALSAAPAMASVKQRLVDAARHGATVDQLEDGHVERRKRISKLADAAATTVTKFAKAIARETLTFEQGLHEVLKGASLETRQFLRSGHDPEDAA
jgi:hypothetical protein